MNSIEVTKEQTNQLQSCVRALVASELRYEYKKNNQPNTYMFVGEVEQANEVEGQCDVFLAGVVLPGDLADDLLEGQLRLGVLRDL